MESGKKAKYPMELQPGKGDLQAPDKKKFQAVFCAKDSER
jgi:hypothetical protein